MRLEPDIVEALVSTIELKDLCTAAHTWRVVMYTRALAETMKIDAELARRMTYGAALHDLGKIDIPDAVLQKPAALTPAEFEVMKRHTVLGYERLKSMGEDDPVLLGIVRSHHERVDGNGYPDGLSGGEIPLAARIFSVVDSFDAMTSVRPYHVEFGLDAARHAATVLKTDVGTHYDSAPVQALTQLYERGELNWILNNFNDRVSLPTFRDESQAAQLIRELRQRDA